METNIEQASSPTHRSIIGLDLLRFAAALLVLSFHFAYWAPHGEIINGAVYYPEYEAFTWFGWIGVQVFFVISGFVIAYSADGKSAQAFARSRFLRLYPAAWICGTITLIELIFAGIYSTDELTARYLRTVFIFPVGPWIDGVYWTLPIEIAFYAFVFFILAAGRFRHLAALMTAFAAASGLFWLCVYQAPAIVAPIRGTLSQTLLLEHGCYFSLGVFIWLVWRGRGSPAVAAGIVIALGGCMAETMRVTTASLPVPADVTRLWMPFGVWAGFVVLITAAAYFNDRIWTPTVARIARGIGLATYPLYLSHYVVGSVLIKSMAGDPLGALIWTTLIVIALSFAISLFVEPAIRRALHALRLRAELPTERLAAPSGSN